MSDPDKRPSPGRSVFISHVRTDEAWADSIAARLRAEGFGVSLPRDAVPSGGRVTAAIQRVVGSAEQIIVLVSEQSSASPWIRAEISQALADGKPVLPVRVESGAPVPPELNQFMFLDAAAMSENEAVARVVTALTDQQLPVPTTLEGSPPAVSPRWVTRADELAQIDVAFSGARAVGVAPMVVLVGSPGVGKTTIARQFVATHEEVFPTVRWLSAPLLAGRQDPRLSRLAGGEPPTLLVIDDVDSYHEVARLLPHDTRTAVLLTSRNPNWGPPFTVVTVGLLTDAGAVDLLRRRLPELDADEVSGIVQELGRLPLTLNLVASLVERQSVDSVLGELRALQATLAAAEVERQGFYYLDTNDPRAISEFERAFAEVVSPSGDVEFDAPEHGSWRRKWSARYTGERLDTLLDKGERAAEVAALARPEGQANRDNAEAIARLLEASSAIPNMVVASGSVLLIKLTDESGARVFSKTLTATELRRFEENQYLLSQPAEALAFLKVLGTSVPGELAE